MKVLLIGASGRLGSALETTLRERGHELLSASRSHAERSVDITDAASIEALYRQVGPVDAVACAAGSVVYQPIEEISRDDYAQSFHGKALSQIELVRAGRGVIAPRGSFTLITGVLAREPIHTSSAASMANGAVESFVRAAALELAPIRVNAVSPTVFTEALDAFGEFFPGIESVPLDRVAQAYVRSIEGIETGRIFDLG